MTAEEETSLADMDSALEGLDESLADAEDDDPRWQERDALETRRDALLESLNEWDSALIAHAGVVLSVDYNGQLAVVCGVIAKGDEAAIKKIEATRAKKTSVESIEDADTAQESEAEVSSAINQSGPRLSKTLIAELSMARARALRLEISRSPDAALALVVFGMLQRVHISSTGHGLDIRAGLIALADHDGLEAPRSHLIQTLPDDADDLLQWLFHQSSEHLLQILALIAAGALDLVHDGMPHADAAKQNLADALAVRLDLDMRTYWSADLDFWSRLPKAMLLDILKETPDFAVLSEDECAKRLKAHAKLTRDALAAIVAKALEGAGWLPELLITPAPVAASN